MSLSEINEAVADSTNNDNNDPTTQTEILNKAIKEEQAKELSYILEAGSASAERIKYLAKKNKYKIALDNGSKKTVTRIPLSARKNKEIEDIRTAFATNRFVTKDNPVKIGSKTFTNRSDILFEAYKKTAEYCLNISEKEYETVIWEDFDEYIEEDVWGLRSIVEACLLRAVHGIAHFRQPSKSS